MSALLPIIPPECLTDEHLCVRCSRYMPTCCQTSEIYVTPGDVERIAAHTGRHDFYEYRTPTDPIYHQHDDDPIWPRFVFQPDGTRRVLKRQPPGDCSFLGPAGCMLPTEVRPLVCRIYPYDYNERGLKETLCTGCPTELLPPGQNLVHALGMNPVDAERWRRQLYDELPRETKFHADRSDLRPAG